MKKIPTLFVRDLANRPAHVLPRVSPGCEWVLAGEGRATRKYDGTCVMLDEAGSWWARREVKKGRPAPDGYVAVFFDETTGKTVGWEPIAQSAFAKWHPEALDRPPIEGLSPGTYELIGPKINGNPEKADHHRLVRHEHAAVVDMPGTLSFDILRDLFAATLAPLGLEGVVWHHPDGRMAKLKVRDFPRHTA